MRPALGLFASLRLDLRRGQEQGAPCEDCPDDEGESFRSGERGFHVQAFRASWAVMMS
jgi:hypothetical protein